LSSIRKNYQASVNKGRLSFDSMETRLSELQGTLNYGDLTDCDLVIEAVFEDMALKQEVVRRLAMGPCRMLDMAGIDVGAKTLIELDKVGGLPNDPSYRAVCQALHSQGRAGQKTGTGYYRYEGRNYFPEPRTTLTCIQLAEQYGIAQRQDMTRQLMPRKVQNTMLSSQRPRHRQRSNSYRA
jgi:3-hydroxyacyl-CoA dehydrogenase